MRRWTQSLAERGRMVAAIADELGVPIEEVDRVYDDELTRLAAQARIRQFIVTLALRRTREILRDRQRRRDQRVGPRTEATRPP